MDDVPAGENPHQKSVDAIAAALLLAEEAIEGALLKTGRAVTQVNKGRKSFRIGPYSFANAIAELGRCEGAVGDSMAAIRRAHDELERIRVAHGLPVPSKKRDGGGK